MLYKGRIELTNQIVDIIERCTQLEVPTAGKECFDNCPLAGACLEYWTGDSSENQN